MQIDNILIQTVKFNGRIKFGSWYPLNPVLLFGKETIFDKILISKIVIRKCKYCLLLKCYVGKNEITKTMLISKMDELQKIDLFNLLKALK